jgi:membrane protein YqaA with SNARE-associated domain
MSKFTFPDSTEKADIVARHSAKWLRSRHSIWILAVISFAESVFAPIIIDPFLIALIIANPKKWKVYIVVSIIASILGGIAAYILGALFFNAIGVPILNWSGLMSSFTSMSENLNNNGFVFVFIGAFTPIPYKLVAIASGVLNISFITFLFASTVGRLLRLGLVGFATHSVGPKALPLVRRNLYTIAAIAGVLLTIYIAIQFFQ